MLKYVYHSHNGSQLLSFMQFQLIFYFLFFLDSADIKAAPVSASWTVTAAEMLAEGVQSARVYVCL